MLKSLRPHFVVMLLFALTLALYYASLIDVLLRPSVSHIDDRGLMSSLLNTQMKLSDILNSFVKGHYFRPFIKLSLLIDQRMYGDTPFGYRFTNVLIHSFNVVLLYLTASIYLKRNKYRNETSLVAALIFAVHPAAVESVSWISGRTDPLATFWALAAILLYFLGRDKGKWYLFPLSMACAFAAALSKEVGLAMLIVIVMWELAYSKSFGYKRNRYSIPVFALFIIVILLYSMLRFKEAGGLADGTSLFGDALVSRDLLVNLKISLASLGFYLKKFIFPFPLNFTIFKINTTLYTFVGLAAVLVLLSLTFFKKTLKYQFLLLWATAGIAPAVLLSLTTIAWTQWAERYLYFSLAPLSILAAMITFLFMEHVKKPHRAKISITLFFILFFFAASSLDRSLLWNDNLRFWRDNYRKSNFIGAAIEYANSYAQMGKLDEAEEIFNKAKNLQGSKYLLIFNLGNLSKARGEYDRAKEYYLEALREARADRKLVTEGPNIKSRILSAIADLELDKAKLSDNDDAKRIHFLEAANYLLQAHEEGAPNNFLLYRAAKLYLFAGEKDKASESLREFIARGGDDHYRKAAKKMLGRIEGGST